MNSAKRVRQMAMIVLVSAALAIVRAAVGAPASSAGPTSTLDVLRLDYAYYNPVSLVLRRQQWIEEEIPSIVDDALAQLPNLVAIWTQKGIAHDAAASRARAAGRIMIQDRCIRTQHLFSRFGQPA